jgi:hypothetical protein
MKAELQGLLEALEKRSIRMRAGVSNQVIAECERKLGFALPAWLSELYLEHDGVAAAVASAAASNPEAVYVLPLGRAAQLSARVAKLGVFVVAAEESDVVAQMLDGVLQGYLVKIPHDGERGPLFRNEREYLQDLSVALRRERIALRDLVPSCGGRRSNEDDHARAAALVSNEAARPNSERRSFQLQMAACLLGSHQSEAFLTVLDDGDRYVRESAEDSLRQLADAPARQLLDTYASRCKQFEIRCKRLVESCGRPLVEVTQRSTSATWAVIGLRGASGRLHWLSLAGYYGRRMDPSFDAWFCERVRELR